MFGHDTHTSVHQKLHEKIRLATSTTEKHTFKALFLGYLLDSTMHPKIFQCAEIAFYARLNEVSGCNRTIY